MAKGSSPGTARSAWSKLPFGEGRDDENGASAKELAEGVGRALKKGIAPVADRVGAAVKSGIGTARDALDDPSKEMSAELVQQSDLPEIEGEDALLSMGRRLDREADLWRGLAMRQLARAGWMDRLSVTSAAFVLVGEVVLASIAGFRAMFASDGAGSSALLLGVGAALLVVGTATIAAVAARIRRSQIEVARDALLRADFAEVRIHRLAALIALRAADPEGYAAALRAFEGDVRKA